MENGSEASLELAKELHNVFVVEELRAGVLKKHGGLSWHKRYFTGMIALIDNKLFLVFDETFQFLQPG